MLKILLILSFVNTVAGDPQDGFKNKDIIQMELFQQDFRSPEDCHAVGELLLAAAKRRNPEDPTPKYLCITVNPE